MLTDLMILEYSILKELDASILSLPTSPEKTLRNTLRKIK